MLEHNLDPSQNAPDAAHTRVKVDVLARAIAALEERKQEEARQREGTALVGDVVQDLQLDVTPEELLAEVQAQTQATNASWHTPPREDAFDRVSVRRSTEEDSRAFWRAFKIAGGLVAAIVLFVCLFTNQSPSVTRPYPAAYQPTPIYGGPLPNVRTQTRPFFPSNDWLGMFPPGIGHGQGEPFHALSAIPDAEPFGASLMTLQGLLRHEPLDRIQLYDAEREKTYDLRKPDEGRGYSNANDMQVGPYARSSWTLIKYHGQPYLRGWVEADTAREPDTHNIVSVFNVQAPMPDGGALVPVTLPLADVTVEGLYQETLGEPSMRPSHATYHPRPPMQNTQELVVRGLPRNPHLWEQWTP